MIFGNYGNFLNKIVVAASALFHRSDVRSELCRQFALIIEEEEKKMAKIFDPWYRFNRNGIDFVTIENTKLSFYSVKYASRPRQVFWKEIPPFIDISIKKCIEECVPYIKANSNDSTYFKQELTELLKGFARHLVTEMVNIDYQLMKVGNGSAKRKDANFLIQKFDKLIASIESSA